MDVSDNIDYPLKSFKPTSFLCDVRVNDFNFQWSQAGLEIFAEFDLKAVDLSKISDISGNFDIKRQNEIWKSTCFEVFFKSTSQNHYFEMNCSALGAWNIYQFDEYRMGMREVAGAQCLGIKPTTRGGYLNLRTRFLIPRLTKTNVHVGLCAIVKVASETQYFALQHSGPKPDFHHQQDWIILL